MPSDSWTNAAPVCFGGHVNKTFRHYVTLNSSKKTERNQSDCSLWLCFNKFWETRMHAHTHRCTTEETNHSKHLNPPPLHFQNYLIGKATFPALLGRNAGCRVNWKGGKEAEGVGEMEGSGLAFLPLGSRARKSRKQKHLGQIAACSTKSVGD